MTIYIHGVDPPCSDAIRSARDLADEGSMFHESDDHQALTGLHVGADGNGQLSQSSEALLFVQRA